jgi:hypothetical protein
MANDAITELVREIMGDRDAVCLLCDAPCADPPFLCVVDPHHDPDFNPGRPAVRALRGARADGQGGALPPHAAEDAVIVIAAILQGINLEFA